MTIYYRYNDRYNQSGHVVVELEEWHSIKETPQGHWCVHKRNWIDVMGRLERGADLKMLKKLFTIKLLFRDGSSRFAKPSIERAARHYHLRKYKQVQHLHYQLARAVQAQGAIAHVLEEGVYGSTNTAYEIDAGVHDPYRLIKIKEQLPKPVTMSQWARWAGARRAKSSLF